jgi:hypothetical protein
VSSFESMIACCSGEGVIFSGFELLIVYSQYTKKYSLQIIFDSSSKSSCANIHSSSSLAPHCQRQSVHSHFGS